MVAYPNSVETINWTDNKKSNWVIYKTEDYGAITWHALMGGNREPFGTISLFPHTDGLTASFDQLNVDCYYRKRGLGGKLVKLLIAECESRGILELFGYSAPPDDINKLIIFYQKFDIPVTPTGNGFGTIHKKF